MYPTALVPLKSKLSRQFFFTIIGIVLTIFTVIYLYTVPLIQQKVFEIERNSSRLALNNVFEIANRMYANVESYRELALSNHKQQLKLAVTLTSAYLKTEIRDAKANGTTLSSAKRHAFSNIREFTYGNNDYIWIADKNGKLLSHPDPRFHLKTSKQLADDNGEDVVSNIVSQVPHGGDGYYRYQWKRLAGPNSLDKISYVKHYPEWEIYIGSGVYLDDLENEVKLRKQLALKDLKAALIEIKIAKTGYLYVFDSQQNMLIHPNDNIEGTHFEGLLDPLSEKPISEELIRVADTGRELHYSWDKPSDPGNYHYEKLSLVRYLEGFDWYICSSVYLDELRSSSDTLSTRIYTLAFLTMLAVVAFSLVFVNHITRPLEELASTAIRVRRGDLSAKSGITRDDEVGILAASFDGMVSRLKHNIDTLDTQVKERTEELLETNAKAQRMNAVGQLAGGLAHDFNNILSIIMGNLIIAGDQFRHVDGLNDVLSPALRATRRGADITHRLLAFSRRQSLQPKPTNVHPIIHEAVELAIGASPQSIDVQFNLENLIAPVCIDPGHFENALINLLLNARDAMPQGGTITIRSERLTIDDNVHFDEDVQPGDYLQVSVLDSGQGFNQDSLKMAFEPFYSTKKDRNNSGLGLSMVYGFVKQSRGYIRLRNQVTGGADIQLLLPLSQLTLPKTPDAPSKIPGAAHFKDKLYLLIEDDPDVRNVVRSHMTSLGLHVVEAASGQEALGLLACIDQLDGVISDIMLPGDDNGYDIAAEIHHRMPLANILLISGNAPNRPSEHKHFPILRKPFDRLELAKALINSVEQEYS